MQIFGKNLMQKSPQKSLLKIMSNSNAVFGLSVDPQSRKLFQFKVSRGTTKKKFREKNKFRVWLTVFCAKKENTMQKRLDFGIF